MNQTTRVRKYLSALFLHGGVTSVVLAIFLCAICGVGQLEAEELQKAGDMESPKVTGRQAQSGGGDPSNGGVGPGWTALKSRAQDGVEAGLTDEIFHGGKQALFVTFTNATKPFIGVVLVAETVPVLPGVSYTVSVWGRLDAANPVSGAASAKAEVAFLEADGITVIHTRYVGKQLSLNAAKPFFSQGEWQQLTGVLVAPSNAASVRIKWIFQKETNDNSPVSGTAYFDDFSLTRQMDFL